VLEKVIRRRYSSPLQRPAIVTSYQRQLPREV
jgi:hypothetical protein